MAHQVAHWKSKAAAADYENTQLHWLLQNVCEVRYLPRTKINKRSNVFDWKLYFFKCGANLKSIPKAPPEYNNLPVGTGADDENDEESDAESYEMEINEDMLDFFAQSMKHKAERSKHQFNSCKIKIVIFILLCTTEDIEDNTEISYVTMDENLETRAVDVFGVNIPDEMPKDTKREKYQQLYGEMSDRINAMETAMQLTFHRNCDMKQPKLWPNMPLKLWTF